MDTIDFQKYLTLFIDWAVVFVPKAIMAGVVLWVGLWLLKKFLVIFRASLDKANVSRDITPLLVSIVDIAAKVVIIFVVAGMVGINTASFIAMLAAAGFAIGLALQGSLGNFAAGLLIILFKPYKVGDLIEVEGKFGEVAEIQIFNTVLVTPGKKKLVIPNGKVIDGVVVNFSALGAVRMELPICVPYDQDYKLVEKVLTETLKLTPGVLSDPEPTVGIEQFGELGLIISVRPFCKPPDYQQVRFEVLRRVKNALHLHGIPLAVNADGTTTEVGA